jgi:hypothetical protein
MSIEIEETMEEIEQRFGSNKAALSDYLQRRKAAGFADHRRAVKTRVEQRRNDAPVAQVAKSGADSRKPGASVTSAKPPAPPAAPKPRALTAEERAAARQKARHDAVMASPHAKDRQTGAAGLLGGAPNLSAEEIITALATMPTDEQTMAKVRQQKADAVWDKVHSVAGNAAPVAIKASQQAQADDVWARIYARKQA